MEQFVNNIDELKENMASLNLELRITHLLKKNQNADLKKWRTACVNRYISNNFKGPENELRNIGEYIEEESNNERTNLLEDFENYPELNCMEYSQSGDEERYILNSESDYNDNFNECIEMIDISPEKLIDKFNRAELSQNEDSKEETLKQSIIEISDNENQEDKEEKTENGHH